MKTIKITLIGLLLSLGARAQSSDLAQLLLDIEKLTQLKGILSDMKTGYDIVDGGYNQVKSIASANYNLHATFLNGLNAVSPGVANYGRVADIILQQANLVTEYKRYRKQFIQSGSFNASELGYMANVYTTLLQQSLENLSRLTDVLTAGKFRMSDAERLKAIDHIYADSSDQYAFLKNFDRQVVVLSLQRSKDQNDTNTLKQLYGL
ncbi:MAG: TerB family tellurite resistance protein [Sphingobacteriales bacterium]